MNVDQTGYNCAFLKGYEGERMIGIRPGMKRQLRKKGNRNNNGNASSRPSGKSWLVNPQEREVKEIRIPEPSCEDFMDIIDYPTRIGIIIEMPHLYDKKEVSVDFVEEDGNDKYLMIRAPGYMRKIEILRAKIRSMKDVKWSYNNKTIEIRSRKRASC